MSRAESSRYDRQIRLWGKTAQLRLMETTVFFRKIIHVSSEIAKNLVLSGVQRVYLEDQSSPSELDFKTNFLLQNCPLQGTAGEICCTSLQRLNPYVKVINGFPPFVKKHNCSSLNVIVEQTQSLRNIYETMKSFPADLFVFLCFVDDHIVSFFFSGNNQLSPIDQLKKLTDPSSMHEKPLFVQQALVLLHVNQHEEEDFLSRLSLSNDYALALRASSLNNLHIRSIAGISLLSQTDSSGSTICGAAIAQLIVTSVTTSTETSWLLFNPLTRCISYGMI